MYKIILILLLLFLSLNASNPKPYALLGDVIYNNAEKIEKLKFVPSSRLNKNKITRYIQEVKKSRKYGFELENKKYHRNKKVYLNQLRRLSKINDQYLRDAKAILKRAMQNNNYSLFHDIVNTHLITDKASKTTIMDYYYRHKNSIECDGVLEKWVNEDATEKARREALRKSYKSKRELELEKIKRIRENARLAKLKLEAELQKDLNQRKLEIRENQEEELTH